MPHRTQLILTAAGLQASLSVTSARAALDSLMAACDQYAQRYGGALPEWVMLADSLPELYKWQLKTWLESKQIRLTWHRGETEWLLTQPPEPESDGDGRMK